MSAGRSGRRMLFRRHFTEYTGGHGKVWDYFNHAMVLGWDARVYLTPGSIRDDNNPWMQCPQRILQHWAPHEADVLFLAGMDWQALPDPAQAPVPVINLIQGMRHADQPSGPGLRDFLGCSAFRICVSSAVLRSLVETGETNGPMRVIAPGLDLVAMPVPPAVRKTPVLIAALKQPELGRALADALRSTSVQVELLVDWMPRREYLAKVAEAEVVVALPLAREGFYLPGLEAMALGCALVMPTCGGNLDYARDEENCLLVAAEVEALASAALAARDENLRTRVSAAGLATARQYSLEAEGGAFAVALREWGLA